MKVAYFAESSADEAALIILTEAILGTRTESISHAGLRSRGWTSALKVLPAVLKQLHYHTDADGFVMILDSNGSPPHMPEHESSPQPDCRLCRTRRVAAKALSEVGRRSHLPDLKVACGLAVPAIEAWLLCEVDSHVTEAAWINGLKESPARRPYTTDSLKQQLYGTSRPSLTVETEAMKTAASRIAQNLPILASSFPNGFGALMKNLLSWLDQPQLD